MVYEQHQQFINQKKITGDILGQFKQLKEKTTEICRDVNYSGKVVHKIIYTNPYYNARLPIEWQPYLLHYNQLNDFFSQVISEEEMLPVSNISSEMFKEILTSRYAATEPYPLKNITSEQFSKLKLGLNCYYCGSFTLTETRYHLTCTHCHQSENKHVATCRFIDDYKLLFPENDIDTSLLKKLNDNVINNKYLMRTLHELRI